MQRTLQEPTVALYGWLYMEAATTVMNAATQDWLEDWNCIRETLLWASELAGWIVENGIL